MKKRLIIFFGMLLIMGVSGLWWLTNKVLVVKHITCQLNSEPCPEIIANQLGVLSNRSLFWTPFDRTIHQISFVQPLQLTKLQKKLPNQILLAFQPITSAYRLTQANTSLVIDQTGTVVTQPLVTADTLPGIAVIPPLDTVVTDKAVSTTLHQPLVQLLSIFAAKHYTYPLEYRDEHTFIVTVENRVVLLEPPDMVQQWQRYEVLQTSLDFQTFSPPIQEVDMRYQQPVLRQQRSF